MGDDQRPLPAEGVGDDAGRDLEHERDERLRHADQHQL
jgi:hypothetical protein